EPAWGQGRPPAEGVRVRGTSGAGAVAARRAESRRAETSSQEHHASRGRLPLDPIEVHARWKLRAILVAAVPTIAVSVPVQARDALPSNVEDLQPHPAPRWRVDMEPHLGGERIRVGAQGRAGGRERGNGGRD